MLSLATSGGVTEAGPAVDPCFFTGFLAEPGPAAQALLATAALAGAVATASQILLKVGDEEVTAVTEATSVTERKVDLPARWIKGFGEVSALHASMRPVAEFAGPDAQRFISSLPRTARTPLWVVPAGRTLSLAASPRPGAACLAGPERLAELRPLLRFTRKLRIYAPPDSGGLPASSAWELTLGAAGARFTLTLSPEKYRGFSGEGALLGALATVSSAGTAEVAAEDAALVSILLGWDPVIDLSRLTASASLPKSGPWPLSPPSQPPARWDSTWRTARTSIANCRSGPVWTGFTRDSPTRASSSRLARYASRKAARPPGTIA